MYAPLIETMRTENLTTEELNVEEVKTLTPAIIYTCILMACGVMGNAIVIYVYCYRYRASKHRFFILTLGVSDFITSALCMPFLIVDMLHPFTFTNIIACRSQRYITYSTSLVSIFTLFFIAVERYRKICHPFEYQITLPLARRITFVIVILTVTVFALPSSILFGHSTIPTGIGNITGVACFIDDQFRETLFPVSYNFALTVTVLFLGSAMIYCYSRIAYQTLLRAKARQARKQYLAVNSKGIRLNSVRSSCNVPVSSPDELKKAFTNSSFVQDELKQINQEPMQTCIELAKSGRGDTPNYINLSDTDDSYIGKKSTKQIVICIRYVTKTNSVGENSNVKSFEEMSDNNNRSQILGKESVTSKYHNDENTELIKTASKRSAKKIISDVVNCDKEISQSSGFCALQRNEPKLDLQTDNTCEETSDCIQMTVNSIDTIVQLSGNIHKVRKTKQKHCWKKAFLRRKVKRSAPFAEHKDSSVIRVTKMFFVITIVYFLSYIPHFLFMNVLLLDDNFLYSLSKVEAVLYYIAWRSFLINAVANPFVYNFMDRKFMKECRKIINRCT